MGSELIELAMKIKISRRRTRLTTYENMELYTTQPIKQDKKKRDQEKYSEQLCRFQLLQQNETAQTGY